MDIATLTNAPRTLRIGGVDWTVRALTFKELGLLQGWLKDNADDPVTEAFRQIDKARSKGVKVSSDTEATLIRQAREDALRWPPAVLSGAWFNLLSRVPGASAFFILTMLRTFQPSLTEEQASAIEREMTGDEGNALIAAALGRDLPPKDGPPPGGETTKAEATPPRRPRARTTGRSTSSGSPSSA